MTRLKTLLAASATLGLLASASQAQAQNCDPPRILIVMDSSSSMLESMTGQSDSKWKIAQAAVKAVTDTYPDAAQYGLMTFPGPSGACSTGTVLVDVAPNSGPQIQSTLANLSMTGSRQTPAGQTLKKASQYADITNSAHKNYVIFITDGWQYCSVPSSSAPVCMQSGDCTLMGVASCPTCNSCSASSTDPACSGQSEDGCYCVRSWPVLGVQALSAAGVTTYVVGFGDNADFKTLNQAAEAGGTAKAGCDPTSSTPSCYYQANLPTELNGALADIVQKVVTETCTGDCGLQGTRTCTASGWSNCAIVPEIDCQGPCGAQGKQKCENNALTECDAVCPDSGVGGAAGQGTGGAAGASGKAGASGASGASGGGGSAGASGSAGKGGGGSGGGSSASGGAAGASASGGKGGSSGHPDAGLAGAGNQPAGAVDSGDEGGCGCRVAGKENNRYLGLLLGLAAGFLAFKRRFRD